LQVGSGSSCVSAAKAVACRQRAGSAKCRERQKRVMTAFRNARVGCIAGPIVAEAARRRSSGEHMALIEALGTTERGQRGADGARRSRQSRLEPPALALYEARANWPERENDTVFYQRRRNGVRRAISRPSHGAAGSASVKTAAAGSPGASDDPRSWRQKTCWGYTSRACGGESTAAARPA